MIHWLAWYIMLKGRSQMRKMVEARANTHLRKLVLPCPGDRMTYFVNIETHLPDYILDKTAIRLCLYQSWNLLHLWWIRKIS